MFDIGSKIKEYKEKSRKKCFALMNWKNINMKPFSLDEMLSLIAKEANGSIKEMDNIIEHLTAKRKVQGRTQVYGSQPIKDIDIIRDENGELILKGYRPDAPLPLKGQHRPVDGKVFRQSDDRPSKTFVNAEERMYDLGKEVRELYPGEDNHFITFAMQAIRKYAAEHKINQDKVVNAIRKGRYTLDTDMWRIVPKLKVETKEYLRDKKGKVRLDDDGKKVPKKCPKCGEEIIVKIAGEPVFTCKNDHYFGTLPFNECKHTIIINEEDRSRLMKYVEMTEHKFHTHIRKFISDLLQDSVNAQPSDLFKFYGFNRSNLLKYLQKHNIIQRQERISDRDENGNPKKATMMVKFRKHPDIIQSKENVDYKCPKKNFDRKLEKLYIDMFEKNLPERKKKVENKEIQECDGGGAGSIAGATTCGASSGAFVTKVGDDVVRRQMPVEVEEATTTTNVGNYQYTAPCGIGDKETLSRKPGGSVSINQA